MMKLRSRRTLAPVSTASAPFTESIATVSSPRTVPQESRILPSLVPFIKRKANDSLTESFAHLINL